MLIKMSGYGRSFNELHHAIAPQLAVAEALDLCWSDAAHLQDFRQLFDEALQYLGVAD